MGNDEDIIEFCLTQIKSSKLTRLLRNNRKLHENLK